MELPVLLRQYSEDRRKLLSFLLSSRLIQELRTPAGPTTAISRDVLDAISADYVIECIKSGGVVEISIGATEYRNESSYPIMIHSRLRDSYFLVSDPDCSGSPPRRVPPPTNVNINRTFSDVLDSPSNDGNSPLHSGNSDTPSKLVEDVKLYPLGLPDLKTGLKDNELRETAYEVFLACMAFSGIQIHSLEDMTPRKDHRVLPGKKSKRAGLHVKSLSQDRYSESFKTFRIQMQISEEMDVCTRKRLMELAVRRIRGHIDIPQISLGLLNSLLRSNVLSSKSYMQWKTRHVNILEELLCFSADVPESEHQTIKRSLSKIKNRKERGTPLSDREEVPPAIENAASRLSSLPGQCGVHGETPYWTSGYHLNIRLYEKLLLGLFDVLDEGQLIEDRESVLKLIKLTWSTLGITQKMHHAIYGWILFQQFVETDDIKCLDHAILELQEVVSFKKEDEREENYLKSLSCLIPYSDGKMKLSLVQAIFFSISIWCDSKLQDYHQHFGQKPSYFGRIMTLLSAVGVVTYDCSAAQLTSLDASNETVAMKLKAYAETSIEVEYDRIVRAVDSDPKAETIHPLALLANELRLIALREIEVFFPVMRCWCPESGVLVAKRLHHYYWEELKPFLDEVSSLSKYEKSVLPAADMLDQDLTRLFTDARKESNLDPILKEDLEHYPIGEVAKPILLDWLIAQHPSILEWTGRAFEIEDWEPLSKQQKHGTSIIEVFTFINETIDQFFGLKLPIDISHLQTLLSIIFSSLDNYIMKLLDQLVDKKYLYPSKPPLTRYEEAFLPVSKKKLPESILDIDVSNQLTGLTISKLCTRLNTLSYIKKQIGILEDGIRKSWALSRKSGHHNMVLFLQRYVQLNTLYKKSRERWLLPMLTCGLLELFLHVQCVLDGHHFSFTAQEKLQETTENDTKKRSEVDELFVTTFDIRDSISIALNKICDFTAAKVIFWDLRYKFLFQLYRGNVQGARLDGILEHLDSVLDCICGLIYDDLRDLAALSVCRASLEGFSWVLLDGGPSRVFSDSDFELLHDDLHMLKEFFVADGDGLPHASVEKEAKVAEEVLNLYSLKTPTLIQMLMSASEEISTDSDQRRNKNLQDAQVLMRVLCHKKDKEASKFLKRQYHLPSSSEYDDSLPKDPNLEISN